MAGCALGTGDARVREVSVNPRRRARARLGLTRGEPRWILIGEIAVPILPAIPLGLAGGTGFAALLSWAMTMDLFRVPWIITPRAYTSAAVGVLVAAQLSLASIAGRLGRFDRVLIQPGDRLRDGTRVVAAGGASR